MRAEQCKFSRPIATPTNKEASMPYRLTILPMLALTAILVIGVGGGPPSEPPFTSDFGLQDCAIFLPNGSNPYFSLKPGTVLRYEGLDDGEFVELEIRVLGQIRPVVFQVDGQWKVAITRIIREREWIDGELVEISHNFYARCPRSNDIFYFGEEVDFYEDGEIVGHDGSWLAGEDDAQPGLIMPGRFLLGSRYFQEVAPDVAMDQARHAASGLTINTPAGVFQNCVKVVETTPLEPGAQSIKYYAPGVGLIVDSAVRLIEYSD
jgi:hypothetical protein